MLAITGTHCEKTDRSFWVLAKSANRNVCDTTAGFYSAILSRWKRDDHLYCKTTLTSSFTINRSLQVKLAHTYGNYLTNFNGV